MAKGNRCSYYNSFKLPSQQKKILLYIYSLNRSDILSFEIYNVFRKKYLYRSIYTAIRSLEGRGYLSIEKVNSKIGNGKSYGNTYLSLTPIGRELLALMLLHEIKNDLNDRNRKLESETDEE